MDARDVCVGGLTSMTAPRYLSGGGRLGFGADDMGAGAVGVGVEIVEDVGAWGMEEKRGGKRGAVQSRAEQDGRRERGGHDIWAEEVTCTHPVVSMALLAQWFTCPPQVSRWWQC